MMPSLFISHGSPNRVLDKSAAKVFLENLAEKIKKPTAIVIFSAHWMSRDLEITNHEELQTIHDFIGFSADLHRIKYKAKQPKWLFKKVSHELNQKSIKYKVTNRGLDHGAWSVLSLSYPNAEIPVIALSLPIYDSLNEYLKLGEALKELRKDDILIIGSGSATHNLSKLSRNSSPDHWAIDFVTWLQKAVENKDYEQLTNIYSCHPSARIAHPSLEHYVPLLIAAGTAKNEEAKLIHDSYELGNLNNSCFKFGD